MKRRPEPNDAQQLLKVAIIGAPNAGKSTLLNKLISWKVCVLILSLCTCVAVTDVNFRQMLTIKGFDMSEFFL